MEMNLYRDIVVRTGGNVYIGIVGPVRTGKSTLIKRIMEELVIPNIDDPYRKARARDELPQCGSGKTIMTAEPKFVPEEAVELSPDGTETLRVRMIDSVGYMVEGAAGATEDGHPRMVTTPWFDHEIPLTQAAELGTKKVMEEHCSIGLVVTTDGSVTDIPREDYTAAEDRAIRDMKATGKPFVVVINSREPGGAAACTLAQELSGKWEVGAYPMDCQNLSGDQILELLRDVLYAFPMQELQISWPRWMDALDSEYPMKSELQKKLLELAQSIGSLRSAADTLELLKAQDSVADARVTGVDLGTGIVRCELRFPDSLYYEILSRQTGFEIPDEGRLLELLTELSQVKRAYDKIASALEQTQATGYGIVMPTREEMKLEAPELIRKGNAYGVKLRAGAPSIHMMRVDLDAEVSPMVGGEQQSRELLGSLMQQYEADSGRLWESNLFGKSVYEMVSDGLSNKLNRIPEDVRSKFRGSLSRTVNEGATGMICILF